MFFRSNLSYLRKKKGLTQDAVAEYLGLTPQAIGLYENGEREPTLNNLIKISRYFEVSVDDLLLVDMKPSGHLLSANLRYLRKRERYSQGEMARLLGYQDKSSFCLIENGNTKLSVDNLVNISEFFGITVDDLLKKDLEKEGI